MKNQIITLIFVAQRAVAETARNIVAKVLFFNLSDNLATFEFDKLDVVYPFSTDDHIYYIKY